MSAFVDRIGNRPEQWAAIPGWPGYEASTLGNVRSLDRVIETARGPRALRGRVLVKTIVDRHVDYFMVTVCGKGKTKTKIVGHFVLAAFRGPRPHGMECCHGNGNSLDDQLDNLRWDTPLANHNDRIKHGTIVRGEANGRSRLDPERVRFIRSSTLPIPKRAEAAGISVRTVYGVLKGEVWAHVQ